MAVLAGLELEDPVTSAKLEVEGQRLKEVLQRLIDVPVRAEGAEVDADVFGCHRGTLCAFPHRTER